MKPAAPINAPTPVPETALPPEPERLPEPAPTPTWPTFTLADIEELRRVFFEVGPHRGGPWEPYRDAHLVLPDWFEQGLDPWGERYAEQQRRLWSEVVGSDHPYDPERDEKEIDLGPGVDAVRRPGFYIRRDPDAIAAASDHVIAAGMLLKHSGLRPGQRALEYGAGFAQAALMLARLGVQVDTVDISRQFCTYVRRQSAFFQVPLAAFHGRFGDNPRPGERYDLVWFYESFHHCVDFLQVVPKLAELLAPGGRVILIGEPIVQSENAAVPYPWGVRLHSEVAAVMRRTGWFELGFTEAFVFELFSRAGFSGRRVECEPSLFGLLWVFELRASA